MATAKKITHFMNTSRSGSVGSKDPRYSIQIGGHPFYSGPGQVHFDPEGNLWSLLNETSERYTVNFTDNDEMLQIMQEKEVPETLRHANGFRGIRHILKPLTAEQIAMAVATANTTPEQILFLQSQAALTGKLQKDVEQAKEREDAHLAELKALRAAGEPTTALETKERLEATEKQLKLAQEELAEEKAKKGHRRHTA